MSKSISTGSQAVQLLTTITTNNNIIITKLNVCAPLSNKHLTEISSLSSGLASLPASPNSNSGGVICSGVGISNLEKPEKNIVYDSTLPPNWDYVKIDLYDNFDTVKMRSKYKLAINVKKSGQAHWYNFMAGLNSPFRSMKRNIDPITWDTDPHYENVRACYAELKQTYGNAVASKVYLKNYATKGQTVEGLSVIMSMTDEPGKYIINLHYEDQYWVWMTLGGPKYLTQAQRKNNIVSTVGVMPGSKVINKKAKDFLR